MWQGHNSNYLVVSLLPSGFWSMSKCGTHVIHVHVLHSLMNKLYLVCITPFTLTISWFWACEHVNCHNIQGLKKGCSRSWEVPNSCWALETWPVKCGMLPFIIGNFIRFKKRNYYIPCIVKPVLMDTPVVQDHLFWKTDVSSRKTNISVYLKLLPQSAVLKFSHLSDHLSVYFSSTAYLIVTGVCSLT